MAQTVPEVPESEAQGQIKGLYDDIRSTLRSPIVPLPFRALARFPDYLHVAWIGLKPNVQTVFFEREADEIRAFAARSLRAQGAANPPQGALAVIDLFHYLNPKTLLAITALRAATNGQQPRLTELTRDEKRQTAPGAPGDLELPPLADPQTASGPARDVFARIEGVLGPIVPCEYRALAQWPDYLASAWDAVDAMRSGQDYWSFERDLRRMAEETVLGLPYRMDINPHVLRQSGLSETELDGVRDVLQDFYAVMPGLVAASALLAVTTRGAGEAERSPLSAAV